MRYGSDDCNKCISTVFVNLTLVSESFRCTFSFPLSGSSMKDSETPLPCQIGCDGKPGRVDQYVNEMVGLLVAAGQLLDILKQPFFGLALAAWVARVKEGNSSHCPVSSARRAGDAVVRVRSGMKMKVRNTSGSKLYRECNYWSLKKKNPYNAP